MSFCEPMLVFGSISFLRIYDVLAKVVVACTILQSKIDEDIVQEHLDDVCGVGPKEKGMTCRFDGPYRQVAEEVGVHLASRKDQDKSFAPAKRD